MKHTIIKKGDIMTMIESKLSERQATYLVMPPLEQPINTKTKLAIQSFLTSHYNYPTTIEFSAGDRFAAPRIAQLREIIASTSFPPKSTPVYISITRPSSHLLTNYKSTIKCPRIAHSFHHYQKLPSDLALNIIPYLSNEDIAALSTTDKSIRKSILDQPEIIYSERHDTDELAQKILTHHYAKTREPEETELPQLLKRIATHVRSLNFNRFPTGNNNLTDTIIKTLVSTLPNLQSIDLRDDHPHITTAGHMHLAQLTHLKFLTLIGHTIKPAVLKQLATLHELESLRLRSCSFESDNPESTDSDPVLPVKFPKLKALDISGNSTTIGINNIIDIRSLTELQCLDLSHDYSFVESHIAQITHLKQLTALNLTNNVGITDEIVPFLANLPELQVLCLTNDDGDAAVTEEGIRQLAQFPKLRTLNLDGTEITAPAAQELAKLSTLEELCPLLGDGTTDEAKEILKKALPKLKGCPEFDDIISRDHPNWDM